MLAYYLQVSRPDSTDRARAVIDALGGDVTVVSPGSPPVGWRTPWISVGSAEADLWRAWTVEHEPHLVVVDGSAEHTLVAVAAGRRVAVVATPGGDTDGRLGAAYAAADVILAPWTAAGSQWPTAWQERTLHLGALGWTASTCATGSRPDRLSEARVWNCVVLAPGASGLGPRERRDLLQGTPEWSWWFAPERDLLQPGPLWDRLRRADVIACAPTQAALAAAVALDVPAVLLLPDRPTSAQDFLAGLAERTGPALATSLPHTPDRWRRLLTEARELTGRPWSGWDPAPGLGELGRVAVAGTTAVTAAPAPQTGLAPA